MSRPIELVTFDLYDTLIELHPRRWERLSNALAKLEVAHDIAALERADLLAEDFYTAENTIQPIRERSAADREAFRLEYMRVWLAEADLESDPFTVRAARQAYLAEFETPPVESAVGYGYRPYPDVIPVLERLAAAGVKRAVISNADADVTHLCERMAFAHGMDLIVTSAIVGWEKPDVRTFAAAFEPLGIDPAACLHIGDQPRSDVVGARAAGMQAALIDRYFRQDPAGHAVPVFNDLHQLADFVLGGEWAPSR